MPPKTEVAELLQKTESYLTGTLLPFWVENSPDVEKGGFLTYFDRDGKATGETDKTFLMQIRMLYTMASCHRAGYGDGKCGELARNGAEFIQRNYWDSEHGGWFWVADREGNPTVTSKVGYGQVFAMYAFSEHYLATGDELGRDAALRTYAAVSEKMADTRNGGYYEIMQPDWQPERPGRFGGDRKSMDVHMHMMEALTTLLEMTGDATHRRRLNEVIDLIISKMLHPEHGTGYIQFSNAFEPLAAIMFDVEWGRDADPEDGATRPLNYTSYGHNVEFIWLLLHAADILGVGRDSYAEVTRKICDHCLEFGIDREFGGVLVEGPHDGPPTITEKQFWQQAEVLVGLLDAVALFDDDKYWDAFRNVYDFVFAKYVNMAAGGEWFERLDREGNAIDDALGHAWKISYHTVRAMAQVTKRLRALSGEELMRYSAVIFDMDGTLTDNLDHAAQAYRKSFSHYTGRTWTNDELFALFGPNCEGICQKAVPDKWQEALEMFYRVLDETYDADEARVPGIEELLGELKARAARLGIVSGGSPRSLEISLKHVGLGGFFEKVVGGSVHGAHKPESIREVLDTFGIAAEAAAYVGDSTYDMQAAREAGVLTIRAAWGKSASLFDESAEGPGPDKTFRTVNEFTAWVRTWD